MLDVLGGFVDGVLCACCEKFCRWIRGADDAEAAKDKPKTALQRDQERLRRQIAERKARKNG